MSNSVRILLKDVVLLSCSNMTTYDIFIGLNWRLYPSLLFADPINWILCQSQVIALLPSYPPILGCEPGVVPKKDFLPKTESFHGKYTVHCMGTLDQLGTWPLSNTHIHTHIHRVKGVCGGYEVSILLHSLCSAIETTHPENNPCLISRVQTQSFCLTLLFFAETPVSQLKNTFWLFLSSWHSVK